MEGLCLPGHQCLWPTIAMLFCSSVERQAEVQKKFEVEAGIALSPQAVLGVLKINDN